MSTNGPADTDDTVGMTSWAPSDGGAGATGPRARLGGRYELLGLLGSGGMGSVYRARDLELDEVVALKMLRRDVMASDRMLERFRREVKLARRVTHANVARTFDIGESGGDKFLTMEYVDGESLSAMLAREGSLSAPRACSIAIAICAGLGAAHAAGVVHRDLKPDNVMIERGGRVVITDFGVAAARGGNTGIKETLGGVVGTPAYMSPEQVEGSDVDARADLYALGVMLFEMITGKMPFAGDTPYSVAAARLTQPPPSLSALHASVQPALGALVERLMARSPDDRPRDARQVSQSLIALAPTLDERAAPIAAAASSWRPPEPVETREGDKTVAVLPFRASGAAEDRDLAEGLTEDLIDTLSMIDGLRVRPRAAVLPLGDLDPLAAGKQLGVQVVVDASLKRLGDRMRTTVRLLSVSDGFQLWAKRFDRSPADLLVVSDEAAAAIAEALGGSTTSAPRQAPSSPEAVELYLQGRAAYQRLWEGSVDHAVALLERAHALAGNDPTILATYARARARRWFMRGGVHDGHGARELAERAVSVAPERGETWLAMATVRFVELDAEAAAGHVRTALDRAPQLADAHELLADLLLENATLEQGIERHRVAASLDPGLRNRFSLARALALAGRWSESEALLQVPAEDSDAHVSQIALGTRLALWRDDAASRIARLPPLGTVPDIVPVQYVRLVQEAVAAGELTPDRRQYVDGQFVRVDEAPRFVAFKHQLAAELLAWLGEVEPAEQHVAALPALGLYDANWAAHCPALASLRGRPAFERALSDMERGAARARGALGSAHNAPPG